MRIVIDEVLGAGERARRCRSNLAQGVVNMVIKTETWHSKMVQFVAGKGRGRVVSKTVPRTRLDGNVPPERGYLSSASSFELGSRCWGGKGEERKVGLSVSALARSVISA